MRNIILTAIGLIALLLCIDVYMGNQYSTECRAKGGVPVINSGGYLCAAPGMLIDIGQ